MIVIIVLFSFFIFYISFFIIGVIFYVDEFVDVIGFINCLIGLNGMCTIVIIICKASAGGLALTITRTMLMRKCCSVLFEYYFVLLKYYSV